MQNEACLTEDSEELKDQSIQMPKILSNMSQIYIDNFSILQRNGKVCNHYPNIYGARSN